MREEQVRQRLDLGAPPGRRELSTWFVCSFLLVGGLLLVLAMLTPNFLNPGFAGPVRVAVGVSSAVSVCGTAVYVWIRRQLPVLIEKGFAYLNASSLALGCLVIHDAGGARLSTTLYVLLFMFGALFMNAVELASLFALIAGGTVFVMWHTGDSTPLIVIHTAFVLSTAGGAAVLIHVLRAQLSAALALSVHQAGTDPMTGLINRRGLQERTPTLLSRANRSGDPVGVLLVDIDHFKVVNDTYGHQVGDEVLRDVAEVIRSCVRGDDLVVRFGGEEFGVLTVQPAPVLVALGERIRVAVARDCAVTVSLGVAWSLPESGASGVGFLTDLAEVADTHMYAAKSAGRNRVSHPELIGWGATG